MDKIEIVLTTPILRTEDLTMLIKTSADNVCNQITATVPPTDMHRYKTVVSCEEAD